MTQKRNLLIYFIIMYGVFVSGKVKYAGVNLAGADFGNSLPGVYNQDYTFPTQSEIDYYRSKGMNIFRLPFKWERLQPQLGAAFNTAYQSSIDTFVKAATSKGAYVILDVHNYARYYGTIIDQGVSIANFSSFWGKLASRYSKNSKVMFGLMNEPNGLSTESWLEIANAAINAIRAAEAKNLILVPGNGFTGAWSWTNNNWYGSPNGVVMKGVVDPSKKMVFEVHQYLDGDSSGTQDNCVSANIGSQRLQDFTNWCRQNGYKAFLGEWGAGRNQVCYDAMRDVLTFLKSNSDVFLGWTWWAGGPWWGDYMFSLDPTNGQDRPQMSVIQEFL